MRTVIGEANLWYENLSLDLQRNGDTLEVNAFPTSPVGFYMKGKEFTAIVKWGLIYRKAKRQL